MAVVEQLAIEIEYKASEYNLQLQAIEIDFEPAANAVLEKSFNRLLNPNLNGGFN